MVKSLVCPGCGREIELSEALSQEVLEKALEKEKETYSLRIKEYVERLALAEKEKRELRRKDEERQLAMEKKIGEMEEKLREEMKKKVEDEQSLKIMELEKKLADALKVNEEQKRKLQQGSQQTQGEVLELELFDILKREFGGDEIAEVAKGVRGADVMQTVVDKFGRKCGMILWESKNAKWSEGWIEKLAEDRRQVNANVAVLVTVNLPESVKNFSYLRGVWVTNRESVKGLAWALRINLGQVYVAKLAGEGKKEKSYEMYEYITGVEFKNRLEAMVEPNMGLLEELEREKRWFIQKWARQEKEIRKVIESAARMYGELQGISGRALPEIKALSEGTDSTDTAGLRVLGSGGEGLR